MKFGTLVGFLALLLLSGASGQVVSIGSESESVSETMKEYCERVEPLGPNLILREATQITGSITDQTTEPFRKSAVELRRFVSAAKQVTVRMAATDDEGKFDLGIVKQGQYRLLLSPSRGFKQAEKLECWGRKRCALNTVLVVNPTDQFTTNCPIR